MSSREYEPQNKKPQNIEVKNINYCFQILLLFEIPCSTLSFGLPTLRAGPQFRYSKHNKEAELHWAGLKSYRDWWEGLEFLGARPGGLHSANIADQGHMVREFDLWYLEIGGLYFRAVKNIIQLSSRCPAGVRRLSLAIGTL